MDVKRREINRNTLEKLKKRKKLKYMINIEKVGIRVIMNGFLNI
jgi:hypothetical protein